MEEKKNSKGISKKTFIISIIIMVIVFAGIIGLVWMFLSDKPKKSDAGLDPNVVTRDNKNGKSLEEIQAEVDASKIGVEIASNCIFETGESYGELNIANTSENGKSFLVRFCLKDTGEEIYKSGRIPPNGKIETAMLDKPLDKGVYNVVAYFESFNEDGDADGNVGLDITLTIKN